MVFVHFWYLVGICFGIHSVLVWYAFGVYAFAKDMPDAFSVHERDVPVGCAGVGGAGQSRSQSGPLGDILRKPSKLGGQK